MSQSSDVWRKCSTCKSPILFKAMYWACNVTTCNQKRTGLVFCSVACWDAHVPVMNHKNAWSEEKKAPISIEEPTHEGESMEAESSGKEVLIVASKLKAYIKAQSGMNSSGAIMEVLSDKVRALTDAAIEEAKKEGRKTVLDRDFK